MGGVGSRSVSIICQRICICACMSVCVCADNLGDAMVWIV